MEKDRVVGMFTTIDALRALAEVLGLEKAPSKRRPRG
jgi:hypothetical protein